MPLFGAHTSISGGLSNSISAAMELGCSTVQLFTKNAREWSGKPLTQSEIEGFRERLAGSALQFPTAHDSYLINLASPEEKLYRNSIAAFAEELNRAEALGLSYLVAHPGAHTTSGEEAGIARVVAAIDEVHQRTPDYRVKILLENTAGQGTTLGWRFEHLASILERVKDRSKLGVCFDTCHAFAAGYPLSTEADYSATLKEFDRTVGLSELHLFHMNDSVKPLGSRVDRHAGLGRGEIGLVAFERLVNDSRFAELPMILETPKEDEHGNAMDPVNLEILRRLLTSVVASDS